MYKTRDYNASLYIYIYIYIYIHYSAVPFCLRCFYADTRIKIQAILGCYFKMGSKSTETSPRICDLERNKIASYLVTSLEIKLRSEQLSFIDEEILK